MDVSGPTRRLLASCRRPLQARTHPDDGKHGWVCGVVPTVIPLSVLDLATVVEGDDAAGALRDATRLAHEAEQLGYLRYWVAEHHGMPAVASSAPAVLLAHVAANTESIRVGSGGVMLPNHAPLVVAEQFGTLEALHPGRIDLGLGRAPGTDQRTARALRRSADPGAEGFPQDVLDLMGYFTGDHNLPLAMPGRGFLPEMWLLGSSTFSAQLAGMLGLPFSFAHHFSPQFTEPALEQYRMSFRPSAVLAEPHAMVAAAVICAPTNEEAQWRAGPAALSMLQLRTNRLAPLPSPEYAAAFHYSEAEQALVDSVTASHIVGDPEVVRTGLIDLVDRTGADELMISSRLFSFDDRVESLALVAKLWR
jgi:luciferase family oxidoreductase group 1